MDRPSHRKCWIIIAGLLLVASPARAQSYCAQFNDGSSPDCGFSTLQQCLASTTGVGGVCLRNAYPQSSSNSSPPPPLPLPPGQTSYQLFPATPPVQQQPATVPPPCNPVVDGTYCATAGGGALGISQSPTTMPAIQSISSDIGIGSDPPATLAGINISGGTTCIGLFRRMSCGG